jgi:putative transposase
MCSRCGNVKKELGLNERIYLCGCGNHMDRDINAAVNIREEGRRLLMKG